MTLLNIFSKAISEMNPIVGLNVWYLVKYQYHPTQR